MTNHTAIFAMMIVVGCGSASKKNLDREELLDPLSCKECHAQHYDEWAGSMHAYAADDPVFLAMNERGQEETSGALGNFCVNCHAPMAVREGATTDGTNLDELPQHLKGITCYFCHSVTDVDGRHNNPLVLSDDLVMRGNLTDPAEGAPHESVYSALLDSTTIESATMCGPCHDIVLPSPPAPQAVHLERTFREWGDSVFGTNVNPDSVVPCGTCHMKGENRPIAEAEGLVVPQRRAHSHDFPGVDVALTPWPNRDRQLELIAQELDTTLRVDICVEQLPDGSSVRVVLDNVGAGHRWPSGAAQDRRAFVEVRGFQNGQVCYESGVLSNEQSLPDLQDPDLWVLRDRTFKTDGDEAHMFWDVATVEEGTIPAPISANPADPAFFVTHVRRDFPVSGRIVGCFLDRVTVRVRLRPMGFDLLDDLVDSGHLDPTLKAEMPVFDLVPNRRVVGIPSLTSVTFEWSDDTRNDRRFQQFPDTSEPGRRFDCIGMSSRR